MSENLISYGNTPQSDFESQYQRIFEAAGCRTQVELADFLDIKQSSISDAKRQKTIPAEWLVKIMDKKGIILDWIHTGNGQMSMKKTDSYKTTQPATTLTSVEFRPVRECTTNELLIVLVKRLFNR